MKLSVDEFKKIRTIQWSNRIMDDGTMYYTPIDEISTNLFNLDLLRLIIAPKFKTQQAVTNIPNFDPKQPVILLPNLELKVSPEVETAMYFANRSTNSKDERGNASEGLLRLACCKSSLTVFTTALVYMIILLVAWCCARGHISKDLANLLQYRFI